MTKEMINAMVAEMYEEEKKTVKVPVYFKRNGKMVRRSWDERKETARYQELRHFLATERVCKCEVCGKMVTYFDLCEGACEDCYGEDL